MRRQAKPFVTEYRASSRRKDANRNEHPVRAGAAPPPAESRAPASAETGHDAAMRAADALFSTARTPDGEEAAAVTGAPLRKASQPARGRILDAIEPVRTELPDASGPKRRGRKPGSKNKPKLGRPPLAKRVPGQRKPRPAASMPVERSTAPAPQPLSRPPLLLPHAAGERRREPFSWLRVRLGPGEKWKRRLPKIAW